MKIYNALLLSTNRELRKGCLEIENRIITNILPADSQVEQGDIDAHGWIVSPGWIDIQINGGFGIDLTTNPEHLWDVAAQLPKLGITGFLPTIITSSRETYEKAITIYKNGSPAGWRGARRRVRGAAPLGRSPDHRRRLHLQRRGKPHVRD